MSGLCLIYSGRLYLPRTVITSMLTWQLVCAIPMNPLVHRGLAITLIHLLDNAFNQDECSLFLNLISFPGQLYDIYPVIGR